MKTSRFLKPCRGNNFNLVAGIFLPLFFSNIEIASAARGHCNLTASPEWVKEKRGDYEKNSHQAIKNKTPAEFEEMVRRDNEWLSEQKPKPRQNRQDISRCSNATGETGNIDRTKNRDALKHMKEFDPSLSDKKNLICVCDNRTKDDPSEPKGPALTPYTPDKAPEKAPDNAPNKAPDSKPLAEQVDPAPKLCLHPIDDMGNCLEPQNTPVAAPPPPAASGPTCGLGHCDAGAVPSTGGRGQPVKWKAPVR